MNPLNPKYLEWYGPNIDLKHTIQICRGERVLTSLQNVGLYQKWHRKTNNVMTVDE